MVGWHHQLNGHELEQTWGDGKGQGSLACCSSWGYKESDTTEWLNNSNKASDSGHLFLLTIHVFFRKMSVQDFSPNFVCFLVLSCMHFLYTLDINLWSVVSLANIFSQLVGCLFILLMVSFAMQKLLSLIRSICLFLFLFPFTLSCFNYIQMFIFWRNW